MIIINYDVPTANKYTNACRTNWAVGAKMKKEADESIASQIISQRPLKVIKPCHVIFKWHEKNHKKDLDNIAFGKKFILDALQKSGVLPNDNQRYVTGFTDTFSFNHEKRFVEISFHEMED